MRITETKLRRAIRRVIKEFGNIPLGGYRGGRSPVYAGPMSSKKKSSGDAGSLEEELRFALTKIPFKNVRQLKDTIEKFGVDPDDEYAWYEWHQQTEGGMDSWFVKNRLSDYTDIPSQWPKKWLKYPGEPEKGFYS